MSDLDPINAGLMVDGQRFRLLLNHLDDLFWSIDWPSARQLHQQPDTHRHWDFTSGLDDALGQPIQLRWPGRIHDDDRPSIAAAFASLEEDDGIKPRREAFAIEYRLQTAAGLRWIRDRGIAVHGAAGTIEQVIGVAEDITARRAVEKLLRDSERELRIVTSAMPIGIAHIDRDLRYRFVNNAHARRRLASAPASIVGRSLHDVLGETAVKLLQPRIDQVLAGWTVDFEIELPLPGGNCHLHATLVPDYDEQKQVRGFVEVTEDITERKRAQARANEREREFKTLAENAPDVIARVDRELRYLYVNRAAELAFGVRRDRFLGRDAIELGFPAAYVAATDPAFKQAFETESEQSVTFDALLNGERRYFLARAVPELDHGIRLDSLLVIVYDVSERMRVQIERDRLLAGQQAAREQAELATRSRDEFLAIVSHELRSPLNGIQSWAEVLRSTLEVSCPLALRAIAGIKIGVEQQVRMIDDLLDATRIMTGKLSLSLSPVLLRPVLVSALDSVRSKAEEKAIELQADIRLGSETIEGDSDRIQQVIWNLLSNAIKFTARGGHVRLSALRAKDFVLIHIEDNGRGIAADFMPQLFERFQRDETGNSRAQDGFGLGLMLVRHLCELHRGNVSAVSAGRGQGATFTVRLPLRAHQPGELISRVWPVAADPVLPGLDGIRLLLVDDHQESRDAMAVLLRRFGAEVEVLGSGEEAVKRLGAPSAEQRPDLLICDVAMPGQDGYQTLRSIRAFERTGGLAVLPAIALTAFVQNEDRIRAHDAGFEMHLSKPVVIEELVVTIAAFVRHRIRC